MCTPHVSYSPVLVSENGPPLLGAAYWKKILLRQEKKPLYLKIKNAARSLVWNTEQPKNRAIERGNVVGQADKK